MLWSFVEACVRGRLPLAECGPLYQLGVIGVLLLVAVTVLIVRLRKKAPART